MNQQRMGSSEFRVRLATLLKEAEIRGDTVTIVERGKDEIAVFLPVEEYRRLKALEAEHQGGH
jgi:prevent-host-death family protein